MSHGWKVGDLGAVVCSCCPDTIKFIGRIFEVKRVYAGDIKGCKYCGYIADGVVLQHGRSGKRGGYAQWRCQKLNPPPIAKTTDTTRELETTT